MAPTRSGSACQTRAPRRTPERGGAGALALAAGLCVWAGGWGATTAWAQIDPEPQAENPVFVDESPAVAEGLQRVREYLASGNTDQAVRTLQKILDEHADGFVVSSGDTNVFEPVRSRVHALLQSSPSLMARYREGAAAGARQMLEAGRYGELVRSRLMTPEGLTGALRLARERVLSGQFDGAALTLLEIADHPDRGAQAKAVSEVAALAARYQPNEGVRKRLGELIEGGVLPALALGAAGFAPEPSLGSGSSAGLVDDLVNQPLGTGVFGDTSVVMLPAQTPGDESALAQIPPFVRAMRYWPAVGERAVYFSNGTAVSAFDRVSMRRLWRSDAADAMNLPPDDQERNFNGRFAPAQNVWEEVVQPVLSAGASMVVAVVGRDFDGAANTEGAEYLTGFDAQTGAVRYAVPLRSLDEQLVDSYSRGPLVSDGRVVVVHMLKRQNQRRLLASVLVGVDATTGKRLWTRVVGSAGVLPFNRQWALTDSTVSGGGVVYRYDRLGVIGAYTVAEGRPLWARRISSKVVLEMPSRQDPWQAHQPLMTSAGIVALSSDRDEVLVLDSVSGRITARRKASDLHDPAYLVATGTHLAAVGKLQIGTLRLDQIESGAPKFSGRIGASSDEGGGIWGRVTAAGDRLLVPTIKGVLELDPQEPAKPVRTVALDAPGSPLALPEGLLVVDDARVHMYCTWAVAASHLKAQIAASPTDAGPAAELLKLAERASRPEEMLPAADGALAALAKVGADAQAAAKTAEQRSSIVASLLRAVDRSIGVSVDQAGATLDDAGIEGALDRAAAAAQAPWDKVAVMLARGSVREKQQRWAEAVDAYQAVVLDATLGSSSAPGGASGSSALSVAADRLTRVLKAGGRGAYQEYDKRFAAALGSLAPDAGVADIEKVAAQFPLAQGVPAAWLRVAKLYGEGKTPQGLRAQARALERGVQAAERTGDTETAVVGELNGTLVKNLLDRSLLAAAGDALARAQRRFPNSALSVGGVPLLVADVQSAINRDLAGERRWARIGTPRGGGAPQVIEGWTLMEPLIKAAGAGGTGGSNLPFIVLHKGDERRTQVALFGPKAGQPAGTPAGGELKELWFSENGSEPWTLVKADARGALFFVGEQNGGRLVRVDADLGKVAWQTEPFGALFPADPPERFGGLNPRMRVAIGGEMRSTSEIVIATDERTVCMVERAGRCAAVDTDTGQSLWTARLPLTRIADATVSGGHLMVVGEFTQPQADRKLDRLALFDSRGGAQLAITPAPLTGVRYIRTTSRGDLILGAGGTIVAISAADLETAKPAWTLKGHPAANAWEAWLLEDRLFLLGDDRSLWEVSALSGEAPTKSIDVQNRLDARTAITVWQAAGGAVAFATGRGVALVDGKGGLAGVDAVNATDGTVLPVVIDGGALLLAPGTPRPTPMMFNEAGASVTTTWNLHLLETAGAQLVSTTPIAFASAPVRMAAIDGKIAISTASGTVVLDAPPTPSGR